MKKRAVLTAAEWKKIHDANKRSEAEPDPDQQNWIELVPDTTTDTAKDTATMDSNELSNSRGGT